ncbi:hypothetical protein WG66_006298 [Moniliophthora roreri]|nr:hypothetical protein WG66_006298 [Moniliophthora roreri]
MSPVHHTSAAINKASEDHRHWLHRTVSCVPMSGPHDPFMARGWLFLINSSFGMFGDPDPKYGLVKVDEQAHKEWFVELLTAQLQDRSAGEDSTIHSDVEAGTLDSFHIQRYQHCPRMLGRCTTFVDLPMLLPRKGRPRPSEEAIAAFEDVIAPMAVNGSEEQRGRYNPKPLVFRLMNADDMKYFILAAYPYRL